jgi:hypothetical protein
MRLFRNPRSTAPKTLLGIGDDAPVETRLAQAMAWCGPRLDVRAIATSLRSEQLRPRILEIDRAALVRGVARQRTTDAAVRSVPAVQSIDDLGGGRLLVYFPDLELADGAAEAETNGFFDVNDAPPWDTWVGLFSDPELTGEGAAGVYLVSWVPAEITALVQKGLDVSMTECIAWLEDSRTGLSMHVQQHGLGSGHHH